MEIDDSDTEEVDKMNIIQGVQSPEGMKFPDFSLTFPDYNQNLMCVPDCSGGSGGMLSQKIFKIRMVRLAEKSISHTKFPDFFLFLFFKNSLTFSLSIKIP